MRLLSSRLKNVVRILQFLREKLNLNCIFLSQEFFPAWFFFGGGGVGGVTVTSEIQFMCYILDTLILICIPVIHFVNEENGAKTA